MLSHRPQWWMRLFPKHCMYKSVPFVFFFVFFSFHAPHAQFETYLSYQDIVMNVWRLLGNSHCSKNTPEWSGWCVSQICGCKELGCFITSPAKPAMAQWFLRTLKDYSSVYLPEVDLPCLSCCVIIINENLRRFLCAENKQKKTRNMETSI